MKTLTLVINIVLILAFLPACALAMTSPMIFDAGERPILWWILGAALSLPLLIIISQIGSWILFRKQNYKLALIFCAFPIANLFFLGILMAFM